MAAPFELPDICQIWTSPIGGSLVQDNVPCRQVPNIWQSLTKREAVGAAGWTHWVDFDPGTPVEDAATWGGNGGQNWNVGQGLRFFYADFTLVLGVIFVEDRFTETDRAYTRAYCNRVARDVL